MDRRDPLVLPGNAAPPWEGWVPSSEGSMLVSSRESGTGGLTLWRLRDFRKQRIDATAFLADLPPAFASDHRWLRNLGAPRNQALELISRNLETGEINLALRLGPGEHEPASAGKRRGAFSASGERLLLEKRPGESTLLSWERRGSATTERLCLPGGLRPVSISGDGKIGGFFRMNESREFSRFLVVVANRKGRFVRPVDSYRIESIVGRLDLLNLELFAVCDRRAGEVRELPASRRPCRTGTGARSSPRPPPCRKTGLPPPSSNPFFDPV